jgi:hypothetical protein
MYMACPHPTMLFCGFQQREKIVSYRLIVIVVLKDSTKRFFGRKSTRRELRRKMRGRKIESAKTMIEIESFRTR